MANKANTADAPTEAPAEKKPQVRHWGKPTRITLILHETVEQSPAQLMEAAFGELDMGNLTLKVKELTNKAGEPTGNIQYKVGPEAAFSRSNGARNKETAIPKDTRTALAERAKTEGITVDELLTKMVLEA